MTDRLKIYLCTSINAWMTVEGLTDDEIIGLSYTLDGAVRLCNQHLSAYDVDHRELVLTQSFDTTWNLRNRDNAYRIDCVDVDTVLDAAMRDKVAQS